MLDPTLIAIMSAVFAAVAAILARVLLKGVPAKDMLSINFYVLGFLLLLMAPWFFRFSWSSLALGVLLLIVVLDLFANFYYFRTFEKTGVGTAIPLLSLAPLFTFILAWLVLGEEVSLSILGLSAGVVLALAVFSTDWQDVKTFRADTLYPAFASSILFGASAVPTKYLLEDLAATNAPSLFMLRALLIATFAIPIFGLPLSKIKVPHYGFMAIRGVFVIGQWLLLYLVLMTGSAGVAVTLGNITPVFVLVLGSLFLRERPTLEKGVAAGLVLLLSSLL